MCTVIDLSHLTTTQFRRQPPAASAASPAPTKHAPPAGAETGHFTPQWASRRKILPNAVAESALPSSPRTHTEPQQAMRLCQCWWRDHTAAHHAGASSSLGPSDTQTVPAVCLPIRRKGLNKDATSEELCGLDVAATVCRCACAASTTPADALQQPHRQAGTACHVTCVHMPNCFR